MNIRDGIVQSMARAYFVTAYANFMDESEPLEGQSEAEHEAERKGLPHAGSGQDWMDHAPATSPAAWAEAWALAKKIEEQMKLPLYVLYADTMTACDAGSCTPRLHTPDQFGHYLAMEAMGHGVTWSDDHAELPWEVPDSGSDFVIYSRDEALAGESEAA